MVLPPNIPFCNLNEAQDSSFLNPKKTFVLHLLIVKFSKTVFTSKENQKLLLKIQMLLGVFLSYQPWAKFWGRGMGTECSLPIPDFFETKRDIPGMSPRGGRHSSSKGPRGDVLLSPMSLECLGDVRTSPALLCDWSMEFHFS